MLYGSSREEGRRFTGRIQKTLSDLNRKSPHRKQTALCCSELRFRDARKLLRNTLVGRPPQSQHYRGSFSKRALKAPLIHTLPPLPTAWATPAPEPTIPPFCHVSSNPVKLLRFTSLVSHQIKAKWSRVKRKLNWEFKVSNPSGTPGRNIALDK